MYYFMISSNIMNIGTWDGSGPAASCHIMFNVLNVKALVGGFNQEKALAGAISVIVKSSRTSV